MPGYSPIKNSRRLLLLLLALGSPCGCVSLRKGCTSDLPLVAAATTLSQMPSGWRGFRAPADELAQPRLTMLGGYQPGKIPVVLIHGLLSSPATWDDLIATCSKDETIWQGCQFWVFQYPTGASYLESAKHLRRELAASRRLCDPMGRDPALSQVVLVGHSMGGLVAKLQVASSGDSLWESIASGPFNQLSCDAETREEVHESLFFNPTPGVAAIVYIATPHRGSQWTGHPLGKLAQGMVEYSAETRDKFDSLRESNRELLAPGLPAALPTSFDHLSPENPLLLAVAELSVAPDVEQHSIVGERHGLLGKRGGDGVVQASSATIAGAVSQLSVDASHTTIHRHPDAIRRTMQILDLRLQAARMVKSP